MSCRDIVDFLAPRMARRGMDMVVPFSVQQYNQATPEKYHLPTYSQSSSTLGILFAGSRVLCEHFAAYLRDHPEHAERDNPFDTYVEGFITAEVDAARNAFGLSTKQHDVRHYWEQEPRMVAMQRLCHVAGLAYYDQSCFLCIHPTFGPWFSLRSVFVIDVAGPEQEVQPPPHPCPALGPHLTRYLQRLVPTVDAPAVEPGGKLDAYTQRLVDEPVSSPPSWRDWVRMRDIAASFLGEDAAKSVRYDETCLEYFYTKNRGVLSRMLARPCATERQVK
ncbi:hypothetical protein RI367_001953 [Sorochytrium milnesiophthora]